MTEFFGSSEPLLVTVVLMSVLGALIFSRYRPHTIFSLAVLLLFIADILTLEQFLFNYVNPSLLSLVLLLLLSSVLERSGVFNALASGILQGDLRNVLLRLGLVSGFASAFLNNTAVVATLMGPLRKQSGLLASRILLPLSYASILGGMLTLVGTSTNLIVNGFIEQLGLASFQFFDFTQVGLPVFLLSLLVLVFVSSRFLPSHAVAGEVEEAVDYFIERRVSAGSALSGRTVLENGLRQLQSMFLVEVVRDSQVISPVGPKERVQEGDVLVFSGDPAALELLDRIDGLEGEENHRDLLRHNLVEVVVSPSSVLIGHRIKDSDFRARFNAAIVAVRRGEQKIRGGVGNLRLRAGDSLLLAVGEDFRTRRNLQRNFVTVGGVEHSVELPTASAVAAVAGFAGVILLAALGWVSLLKGLLILLTVLLLCGAMRVEELRQRFPFELLLIVGGALGLAQAMQHTGVAQQLAEGIDYLFSGAGMYGVYVGIFVLAWLLTELVTNNAAAALVFPLAYAAAGQWGVSPYPFFMAVAFGASASFLSPYGYQTNLMVFSAGQYRLRDYVKVGLPVLLIYSLSAVTMIPVVFPF